MIRDGSLDPNWQFGVGALWFDGSQGAITGPINVTNALIEQSPYEAVQWVEGTVSGVNLSNVTIAGTGTFALQEQTGGAAKFTNVTATGVGALLARSTAARAATSPSPTAAATPASLAPRSAALPRAGLPAVPGRAA